MNNIINHIIRIAMGVVFIYASYDKILDPISFSQNIHNYGVTPLFIENIIALTLPWVELFIGVGLIFKFKYEASLDISIVLMVTFILLITQAYLRGKSIDCGCFLNEISNEEAATKRFEMIKRIGEDFIFLILLLLLKYRTSNKV